MKTMTDEQRTAKNLAQKAYRQRLKEKAAQAPVDAPAVSREEIVAAGDGVDHAAEAAAELDAFLAGETPAPAPVAAPEPPPAAPQTPVQDAQPQVTPAPQGRAPTVEEDEAPRTGRARPRGKDMLPTRVLAARIPHATFDRLKALCESLGRSQIEIILAGIELVAKEEGQ